MSELMQQQQQQQQLRRKGLWCEVGTLGDCNETICVTNLSEQYRVTVKTLSTSLCLCLSVGLTFITDRAFDEL